MRVEDVADAAIVEPATRRSALLAPAFAAVACGRPYKLLEPGPQGRAMGYEAIGMVEVVGAGVRNIRRGDFVIVPFALSDGSCASCHECLQTSCINGGFSAALSGCAGLGAACAAGRRHRVRRAGAAAEQLRQLTGGNGALGARMRRQRSGNAHCARHRPPSRRDRHRVDVPHCDGMPAPPQAFYHNVTVSGGLVPVRAYIDGLLPDVLEGRIEPRRAFDREMRLDQVLQGYRALDQHESIKLMLRP